MDTAPSFTHDQPGTPASAWLAAMRRRRPAALALPPTGRLLVVAAHPDDETLGAAGLLAQASDAGWDATVVVLSDGASSHPHSPTHTPQRLAEVRAREVVHAVGLLAPRARLVQAGLADGGLRQVHDASVAVLSSAVAAMTGPGELWVCAPWRHDGHPDHAAAACAAAAVQAAEPDGRLLEYPIWAYHWGEPGTHPWERTRRLELGETMQRKQQAMAAHVSQVRPLSDRPDDEALLGPELLAHFAAPHELFVEEPGAAET